MRLMMMMKNFPFICFLLCVVYFQCFTTLQMDITQTDQLSAGLQSSSIQSSNDTNNQFDQNAINAIVNAFKSLPIGEIDRLGVNLESEFVVGTSSSQSLIDAWIKRQAELRQAVESMSKPAEHMANISRILLENNTNMEFISDSLIELEGLLSDIDNARDFHSIGGWPILISYLSETRPIQHKELAAWAIGSAIKNNYDYQLWTLQSVDSITYESIRAKIPQDILNYNCIELLIRILSSTKSNQKEEYQKLQQRILYALASSSRGNVEVQEFLSVNVLFVESLEYLADSTTPVKILRKVWSYVSDMLRDSKQFHENFLSTFDFTIEKHSQLHFSLLGDVFCSNKWITLSLNGLKHLIENKEELQTQSIDYKYALEGLVSTIENQISYCKFMNDEERNELNLMLSNYHLHFNDLEDDWNEKELLDEL